MVELLVMLIPLCPLIACAVIVCGGKWLKEQSHWPAVIGCAAACLMSWSVATTIASGNIPQTSQTFTIYEWMQIPASGGTPPVDISVALRIDALSATMLSMLTFVATLVAFYAQGYMHGDQGYPRFFAAVSLFVFSMIMLVLSANFVLLFCFWEAVGLCSYLLIGYWYEKPSAASAGQKAFVVNRIGDFGFACGIFLIWTTFGSVNYADVLTPSAIEKVAHDSPGMLESICLCLFAGAIGKSAQFPLHVWLPDAMEGPTPVSALIHAATMVTAGVYMVTRCTPLYMEAPNAQLVVSVIGGLTALIAALIALTQTDLKRVLAYSTVSQLGFMFLGLGTGSYLGIAGAMFHLVTHAFFKALLFLGSGSVMHAMGGVIDMREFSGLRRLMPVTYWTFFVGALALAGLPPLSGFWSKDTILSAVHHAAEATPHEEAAADHDPKPPHEPAILFGIEAATWYKGLFWSATLTAFLTAFYTFRALLMTFHGPEKIPAAAGHHAHESPWTMLLPLQILAVFSVFLGGLLGHLTGWFDGYLDRAIPGVGAHHEADQFVMVLSSLVAGAGILLAFGFYGAKSALPAQVSGIFPPLTEASKNRFYFDELYRYFIVLPLQGIAQLGRFLEFVFVDGILIGLPSRIPRDLGQFVRPLQNGLTQFYAVSMLLAMALLMWTLIFGPRAN